MPLRARGFAEATEFWHEPTTPMQRFSTTQLTWRTRCTGQGYVPNAHDKMSVINDESIQYHVFSTVVLEMSRDNSISVEQAGYGKLSSQEACYRKKVPQRKPEGASR